MQRLWTCLVVALALNGMPQCVRAADSGPEPVYTSKVHFRIPFRYDTAEMERLQAREVQLFMSNDHGAHWRMVDKANPRGDHFDFQAPCDGEYWFAVRTMDSFNRLHPEGGNNIEAGLKVVIDATPPVLELVLTEIEPGKVELRWMAADDHLDIAKLRLEYRQPDSPDWQQVGVVPEAIGQTTWTVPAGGVVAVRGSIADLASNVASSQKDINIHPGGAPQKGHGAENREPVAMQDKSVVAAEPQRVLHSAPPVTVPQAPVGSANETVRINPGYFAEPAEGGPQIDPWEQDRLARIPRPRVRRS